MYDPQDDTHGYCCEEGAWPTDNEGDGMLVLPLVLSDLKERAAAGNDKYGHPYRVNTREDALQEVYEEILDAAMYIRAAIEQQKDLNERYYVLGTAADGRVVLSKREE